MSRSLLDRGAGRLRHPAILVVAALLVGILIGRVLFAPAGDPAHGPSESAFAEVAAE